MTGEGGDLASLALLARGLSGIDVRVQPLAESALRRAVLVGTRLLLPDRVGDARVRRAMVAHAVAHLRYSTPGGRAHGLTPMGIAVISAIEDARVERLLGREFPGLRGWFIESLAPAPDPLDLRFEALIARMDRALSVPGWRDGNHWVDKARRLFDETAANAGLDDGRAFRAVASILANDLGQMRVRFEPRAYEVPALHRDDNSHLWDFGESQAPDDEAILLRQARATVLPSVADRGQARDAVRREGEGEGAGAGAGGDVGEREDGGAGDSTIGRHRYPEWDRRLERLRPDWCTVIEKRPARQDRPASRDRDHGPVGGARIAPLALPRAHRIDRAQRLRRQWDGEDIDLDAAIDVWIDRRLRLRPDARLFRRAGKGPRPVSVLVLLDLSASVNDIGATGRSLLDIEKQAALLLAASSAGGIDRLAIDGFSSNTRAEVRYDRLLDFGRPLDEGVRAMIDGIRGRHSTRLGAALRHATRRLAGEPDGDGQRAIVVVTDGAPSDIDVHDPRYLIEDARQAVMQAREAGVRVACLAVDGAAEASLKRIFGWHHYGIVDDPRSLPARLASMSRRLAAVR
ncbi:MAG: VWA domain-containing protein [Burkholderiaceae bacterium]